MDRATALTVIKEHQEELKALGVSSLSLFGSTARGDARERSDVDVAVRLEPVEGGLAYFGRLDAVERLLRKILGVSVDVVAEPAPRPHIQREIDRDRCLAF